ncbi:hypothetical protein SAMN06272775_4004 [Streptomyces sp. 2323.1]|uniref:hypothetical protein n=1 Tax=Streptomyces sp. 2323.1 TaxID=1938841 RepID=UPI000BBFE4B5|nr:hypothetical protein [Streptomyces sp. 2323.1]SOE13022.1 hypothetical protein SAMN06272775_4004 [Streptomyces sp. 2323.1]
MEPPRSISVDDRAGEPAYRFGAGHGPRPLASGIGEPARPGSRPPRGTAIRIPAPDLDR